MEEGHNRGTIALIVLNFLIFAAPVTLNVFAAFPQHASGVFENEIRNLSLKYTIDVMPVEWTFYIWGVIYIWLLLAKLYGLILLCRKNSGRPAYKTPTILTKPFLIFYTIGLLCMVAWLLVWDREFIVASVAVIGACALALWISMGLIHGSVYRNGPWMAQHARVDLWMYRILWHNAITAFAMWTTIVFLLNLGVLLKYIIHLNNQDVAYVVLGSISGIAVLYAILENTLLDRYLRYTITLQAVVIVAMVGMFVKQYHRAPEPTKYFIVALWGVACFLFVVHFLAAIIRACKKPLYQNNKVSEDPVLSIAT